MKTKIVFASIALIILTSTKIFAEKDKLEKVWYNQEKTSKIEIYKAVDGKLYGKIVWLDKPNDEKTGKPKTDKENPEEKKQNTPLMNLLILRGYQVDATDPNLYTGGTIYDPKNGKTYCGKITYKGKTLDLRGYICSMTFLGRTSEWTLAE